MPEHVYVSHGETIVAEADLEIGSLVLGGDEGAQIVVPPQLCPVNFARVELSVDGSVHVATLTGTPIFDAAGVGRPRQQLDHGGFVRAAGFTVTRLRFAERPAAAVRRRRVNAVPTAASPEIAAPSGPPMSIEVESHGLHWRDDLGEDGIVYGRGDPLDDTMVFVSLDDGAVSAEHVAVYWKDGHFWASDLGSSHGFTINGRRIPPGGKTEITEGDMLGVPGFPGSPTLLFSSRQKAIDNPRGDPVRSLLLGRSDGMREVHRRIKKFGPMGITVLILGETGTGKELAARALHLCHGADRPFLAINCGAIAASLLESELFGHVKGAFTGAIHDKPGPFELASGGTVFLDEIGEISHEMQVKLLRVIEAREVTRVGASHPIPIHVRIVAGTHRPIAEMVATGGFREDFYQRLNVGEIPMPALRDRPEDIALLARHWLHEKHPARRLADGAIELLARQRWPGNVRQLQNVIERSAALSDATVLQASDLILLTESEKQAQRKIEAEARSKLPVRTAGDVRALEKELVQQAIERCRGNVAAAARELGVKESTLRSRCKAWGI